MRAVPDRVMVRLAEQAEREGLTLSEWVRQLLEHAAGLRSPVELAEQRARLADSATPAKEFEEYYAARLHRRPR